MDKIIRELKQKIKTKAQEIERAEKRLARLRAELTALELQVSAEIYEK